MADGAGHVLAQANRRHSHSRRGPSRTSCTHDAGRLGLSNAKSVEASMNEVWILGATGRSGRAIAAHLAASRLSPVLVGARSDAPARTGRDDRRTAADRGSRLGRGCRHGTGAEHTGCGDQHDRPFTETALPIVRASPPGTHYVDLAKELFTITALLGLHAEAVAAGRLW